MALKQVIDVYELLETPRIEPNEIKDLFVAQGLYESEIEMQKIK